ncbi:ubiquitin-protein ligase E3 [Schizosaccharomyces cryophilus OY26]|uniref:RING-type E3 ubiquitin transferase n=1 Tax=Schizosaccharomyces cryophilus (strain OY26 / ATCC MYA-4695 / CBS 11777 / NBRC 106824 / NRRL Y48691) TaxID=653667 RepID=S9VYT4_SCHCR|nr:ubiquitin-protein ligase E3 [Schizosaccharomyces cryophilus OY26]EPY51369.1 ubiquitin-protein ligase E3 [Schizosaccharomyces cryophilus OY26]
MPSPDTVSNNNKQKSNQKKSPVKNIQRKHANSEEAGRKQNQKETGKNSVKLQPAGIEGSDHEEEDEKATTVTKNIDDGDEEEEQICFICAEPISYTCILPCNHRMCHICAIRLRALYKTKECTFCKVSWDVISITQDHNMDIRDVEMDNFPFQDNKHGVVYDDQKVQDECNLLLQFNCPEEACDITCKGWFDLKLHCKVTHHKYFCDLCINHKKVFTHEHTLFSKKGLTKHYEVGDQGTELDVTGFKGHPKCGFCNTHFYDDDELYKHCRERHERCYICDQLAGRPTHQYYRNYDALERHFEKDHFVCSERECVERKFVVFGSEIDLKAHQLEEHPQRLSARELREARRIIPEFEYEPPGSGSGRSRRNRKQPSNALTEEATSSLANLHLSREEIAHIRQEEYMHEQQARNRAFGFALSSPAPSAATASRPISATASRTAAVGKQRALRREEFPSLNELTKAQSQANRPSPSPVRTTAASTSRTSSPVISRISSSQNVSAAATMKKGSPMASNVQAQHQQVIDRMMKLTGFDENKVNEFKFAVSSFRGNVMSAREAVDRISKLVSNPQEQLSGVINHIADLLEDKGKSKQLLEGWQEWKIMSSQEQPHIGTNNANLLRLKKSNRTAAQTASVWNRIETAAKHSGPALSAPASRNKHGSAATSSVPSKGVNAGPRPTWGIPTKTRSSAVNTSSEADFPSLPPSTSKRIQVPIGKKPARGVDPWAAEVQAASSSQGSANRPTASKRKNGKKQTVLFHLG